jgi:hypothetical protein
VIQIFVCQGRIPARLESGATIREWAAVFSKKIRRHPARGKIPSTVWLENSIPGRRRHQSALFPAGCKKDEYFLLFSENLCAPLTLQTERIFSTLPAPSPKTGVSHVWWKIYFAIVEGFVGILFNPCYTQVYNTKKEKIL